MHHDARSERFSITRSMTTEEGVYGLILVSGIIAAMGSSGAPAWRTLIFTALTVIVFWAAHIYSGTVAAHGTDAGDGQPLGLGKSLRLAIVRARGMLAATVFPAIALALGALGFIREENSYWLALWVGVAALAWLGYAAYTRKGASLSTRIIGALATASFGIVIVIAKAIVTH